MQSNLVLFTIMPYTAVTSKAAITILQKAQCLVVHIHLQSMTDTDPAVRSVKETSSNVNAALDVTRELKSKIFAKLLIKI